jgi:hypothetical protein
MLPKLEDYKIKLVYKKEEYKYTILTKKMIYVIRTVLELEYKYSTVWNLMFSTYIHGHSYLLLLDTFKSTTGPYLMVLKTPTCIHGVYFEESLEVKLHPYGLRKKFIFTINDGNIQVHDLDLVHDQIVCLEDYFSFGYTKTGYKLMIDKTLMKGQSYLEEGGDFNIEYLELYRIVD